MTTQHLFVYGTLQPGQPNAHILESIGGTFTPAYVHAHYDDQGWGKTMGYPGLKPDPNGPRISGYIFSSDRLCQHWPRLDEFEGEAYERRRISAVLSTDETIRAYVYQIAMDLI